MEQIDIQTGTKHYPVFIGHGAIQNLGQFLKLNQNSFTSVMVITDETVGEIHLSSFRKHSKIGEFIVKKVPSGEKAKTFDVYYDCLTAALEHKLDRKSLIIAFGGGAVGDLAGFVAATYMRGIRFVQVPTTILAHDSAVGGKVAINHPAGKNMIGAFHQPEAVVYDLGFLKTLPLHEVRSGFAEVIKHALIADPAFYEWLIHEVQTLEKISSSQLEGFLAKGINIKGRIVAEDERESGIRAYLNFGHTLGHAIEAEAGYGKVTHGEAVAIGMIYALGLSRDLLGLSFDIEYFKRWLKKLGYMTAVPASMSAEQLVERMKQDKKNYNNKIRFVLLNEIGSPKLSEVDERLLLKSLKEITEGGESYDQGD